MPQILSRRASLILIVALLLGLTFIAAYDNAHTRPGVASEAMLDLGDALRISRGIPFPADFTDRPEMSYRVLLAGWFLLLGPNVFAAQMNQICIALLTVALTYRAGLLLLSGHPWRRLGALIAAGTFAAIPPYLFNIRSPYRALLVPLVVTAT